MRGPLGQHSQAVYFRDWAWYAIDVGVMARVWYRVERTVVVPFFTCPTCTLFRISLAVTQYPVHEDEGPGWPS